MNFRPSEGVRGYCRNLRAQGEATNRTIMANKECIDKFSRHGAIVLLKDTDYCVSKNVESCSSLVFNRHVHSVNYDSMCCEARISLGAAHDQSVNHQQP